MPTSTKKYLEKVALKSDLKPSLNLEISPAAQTAKDSRLSDSKIEILPEVLSKPKKTKAKKSSNLIALEQLDPEVHHKTERRIAKLEQTLKVRTIILVVLVLIALSSNLIFVFLRPQSTNQSVNLSGSDSNQRATLDSKLKNSNQASVYIFENNPAIFDFGFKIDLKADYIANLNDPNCQTPIVPPTVNGCGFGLDLQKIGLPKSGIVYHSITLVTEPMTSSQKIQIDLKDYEKGQIVQSVGLVNSDQNSQKIILPSTIPNSQSLYFRFWAAQNVIKIKKILIDYFSLADLRPVQINLATPFKTDQTGTIYLDADGDGKFSQKLDKRWECMATFPGVLPIDLKDQTTFKLTRGDSCMTETKPASWQDDLGAASLPTGKWLLVLDPQTVASFETKADSKNSNIDLKF